jgi:hypothetical protein
MMSLPLSTSLPSSLVFRSFFSLEFSDMMIAEATLCERSHGDDRGTEQTYMKRNFAKQN